LVEFLSDRKILIGIGIGMVTATIIMTGVQINVKLSRSQIEEKASGYGMRYPEDFKVINKDVNKK